MGKLLPGRTVAVRFTLMYAAVFLMSGIGLLTLTNLFAAGGSTDVVPAPGMTGREPEPAAARQRIDQLEGQLADLQMTQSRGLLVGSLIALIVMAAVSILLGKIVSGHVLRPLRTITAATRRITAENLHERLSAPGPDDEVKGLADTIDDLLERLEAAFAAQRRFVADASHELRTPLTTIRASLDVATAKPEPAPQTVALADRLRVELDRVDRLLEGLLVLARAQHGELTDRAPISLGRLAGEALTAREADVAAKNLTVDDRDLQGEVFTEGSSTLLARLVHNLVDNAVVHNRHGGWIRLAATTGEGAARLTGGGAARLIVETGGPVLDQEQVAGLAQPFRRLGTERTGSDDGSGLGLSIVSAIVTAHGGRLDMHARPEGGLRVTVTLPAAAREGAPA